MFIVQMKFLDEEAVKRAFAGAVEKVRQMEKKPGVLEKAGRVGNAFKALLTLGSAMVDLDPTGSAKIVFSVCAKAWEHLEQQERQDAYLNELVHNLARTVPSVDSVKNVADGNLRETVMDMLNLIEDVSLFILNFRSRSAFERTWRAAINPDVREKTQAYITKFENLRKEFDTRVNVQSLRAAEIERMNATLRELKPADLAGYDPDRQCIPGTRVGVIDKLVMWAQNSDDGPRLAWVHGLAGLGKSSVATSVCRRLDDQRALTCSFFCKRDNPELRDPRRVLTTIICGLALRWEAYRDAVVAVIREDVELSSKHIQLLYDSLVTKPLQRLVGAKRLTSTLVIVVDALDECGEVATRKQLLASLLNMSQLIPSLKIIATSRPDADIQEFFRSADANRFTRCDLLEYDASDDIRIFVQDRLGGLEHTEDWPKDAVERLSIHSSGLFIWARTACKFIIDGYDRRKRLNDVLASTKLTDIDTLYTTTVKASIQDDAEDNMDYVLGCLGAVVVTSARTPLSIPNLVELLDGRIPRGVIERVVGSLSSVLYVDQKLDGAIRISHPSFVDYITTPSRSKSLCVDVEQHNTILAECCFQVMASNLRFNICGLETSDLPNSDVLNLDARVRDAIHPHLSYSCLYWSSHVAEARLNTLESALRRFLFGLELIYWLEALSLVGRLNIAPGSLLQLMACCSLESMQDCRVLVNDAYRFVLSFYDAISRSTPHLYISALAFAPENSDISRRTRRFFPRLLVVTGGAEKEWTRCLRSIWVSSKVESVAFSPDSRRIVSGSHDGTVRIWDAETGDPVLEPLKGHTDWVTSVAFSPNGRWIVSGSYDKALQIWDAGTGKAVLDPLRGHSARVWSVAFSPDSRYIVSGSEDKTLRIWDAETGKSVLEPPYGHTDEVLSVTFSPDSHWIVSGSLDNTVRIWDARTGSTAREPLRGHSYGVKSVAFSPDSHRIASCSIDKTVRVWDAKTGDAVLKPLKGHSDWVRSIAFSPDSRRIISGSDDRTVRIWDAQTGDVLDMLDSHSASVQSVAFSPDGRRVVSGSLDKTMRIWDVVGGGNSGAAKGSITSKSHSRWVCSVGFSSSGRYVASGSNDMTVRIWDAETGVAVLAPLEGHSEAVQSVAFSPDDRWVVSGSTDRTVRIWDAETGNAVLEPLRGHSGPVESVAFSPDGHLVASGSYDRTVRIWNAETGAHTLPLLTGHSGIVCSVAFSPDGHRLVSCSEDCTIRIWDTGTGQLVLDPLTGHSSHVMSVAFSSDGRRIVSGSIDGTVRLWDAETGYAVRDPLRGHATWVLSVVFSSDGRWIASGSSDGTVCIWDAITGKPVFEPMCGHSAVVFSVAFSPDGRRIVSGSRDMTVRIWDAESHTASTVHNPRPLPGTQIRVLPPPTAGEKLLVTSTELARHMPSNLAGWVTSSNGELLVWLPPEFREIEDSM
ncbi:hypothetical protein FRC06_000549, partial [Ceratobasidium sp. 370]